MKLTANPAWLSLPPNRGKGSGAKFLRIMKLTTIIILAACLHTSAKGVAQQTITFSGKEVSLESVFTAIKKQTNYRFFFNTDMLATASKVTLDVKNAQIEQVMNMALKDQPLTFTIKGRTIFVMKKVEEEKKSTQVERTGDPITVSGKVLDENGAPAQGVNVTIKGTSKGTTTNIMGEFVLSGVDKNSALLISSVGYDRQEILVNNKTFITAQLKVAVGNLDELQVIAYGTTSKRFQTGNVTTIKASDIEKQPINNPLLALQGRVPGLFIAQSTGLPGSGVYVRIQGQNSLGNGSEPLYVIDGVPYSSQALPTVLNILGKSDNTSMGGGSPLSFINPADIASIDVLKDADATAIYGSRAANGAILITTKKATSGKTQINFKVQQGWSNVARKLELFNLRQYLDMRYEALKNDGIDLATVSNTSSNYYDLKVWDTTRSTDWQKELLGSTAQYQDIQSSVSGGTTYTQFLLGAGYHRETTVFPGELSDQKASLHFNVNHLSVNGKFRVSLSGNYIFDNNQLVNTDLTSTAIRLAPNAPALHQADESLNWEPLSTGNSSWTNPLSYLKQPYKNKVDNMIGDLVLSYQILPGLVLKNNLGYTYLISTEISQTPIGSKPPEQRVNGTASATFGNGNNRSWIIEPQLSYNYNISEGKLDFLLGMTIQNNERTSQRIFGGGYTSDLLLNDLRSAANVSINNTFSSVYKYNAFFGRINYNLKDKYIINLTSRRDGSSRFGVNNQFHDFWSVGGAWIFSNEAFLKRSLPFMSFGKLRASYGVTGSDQIGDYKYLNLYTSTSGTYQTTVGLQPEPGGLSNPYLAWEETRKLQIGVNLGFLGDRIMIDATYSRNRSSNQLVPYTLPSTTGSSSITQNFAATIQNRNWEFLLSADILRRKNFVWASSLNLTIPENKLLSFPGIELSPYASLIEVGRSIVGFNSSANIKSFHSLGVDPTSGQYIFEDINGNSSFAPNYSTDRISYVNTAPVLYGGLHNNFRYKGFQLDFLFQFVKQNGLTYFYGLRPGPSGNQPITVLQRWQKPGDTKPIAKYSTSTSSYLTILSYLNSSDAVYADASYARLKNLSVSWQMPENWQKRIRLQNLRIYAQGQNLITFTNYDGIDPENQSSTSLPPLRVWTFGLQVGL